MHSPPQKRIQELKLDSMILMYLITYIHSIIMSSSTSVRRFIPPSEKLRLGESTPRATPSRGPTYSSRFGTNEMTNTSLPMRHAPVLEPQTLATLTGSVQSASITPTSTMGTRLTGRSRVAVQRLASEDEFPPLGLHGASSSSTPPPLQGRKTFADLSKEWAKKNAEDEEKKKEEERNIQRIEAERRRQREEDEKMKRLFGLGATSHLLVRSLRDEEDEDRKYNIGGEDREALLALEEEEEEEWVDEVEEPTMPQVDDSWEYKRRNRHDL